MISYLYASITKHFYDYRGNWPMLVNPEQLQRPDSRAWTELRIDGPFIHKLQGCIRYDMEVNILISTHLDANAPRRLQEIQDHLWSALYVNNKPRPIVVRTYGVTPVTTVGCLNLWPIVSGDREVRAFNLHQIQTATKLHQGGLEAHYRMLVNA